MIQIPYSFTRSYRKVTSQTAVVASAAGASSAQTQSWAISLYMAKALAVIALLGLRCSWQWATVGFVSYCRVRELEVMDFVRLRLTRLLA